MAIVLAVVECSFAADPIPPSLLDDTIALGAPTGAADLDTSLLKGVQAGSGPLRFLAGTEATFLAPIVPGNTVATEVTNLGTGDSMSVLDDYGLGIMTFAPRVWLGVSGDDGWGVTGRFWYLTDTQMDERVSPVGSTTFEFGGMNRIKLYTVDLEATRDFQWRGWLMTGAVGARYASLEYGSQLSQSAEVGVEVPQPIGSTYASSERFFSGTGVTFALGGRRPWWPNSAIHWIWNARGSAIFGNADYAVRTRSRQSVLFDSITISDAHDARFSDTLFIAELQAGLQWEHRLQAAPATAFFRLVCEYQYWGGVNDTDIRAQSELAWLNVTNAFAWARGVNIGLIGLTLGTGFTW